LEFKTLLMDDKAIGRTLKRLSHEIIEKNKGIDDIVLIGIERRGVPIATRISEFVELFEEKKIPVGSVNISLYRDDLSTIYDQPVVKSTDLGVDVKDKIVILVDDVLYTGRTVRAAIDAVIQCGRPKSIQLAVLVDRGHRELPIRADYVGKNIPTSKEELVSVLLKEIDQEESVKLYE